MKKPSLVPKKCYVGGTFDGVGRGELHDGHKELLDIAVKVVGRTGTVIVAVNSDDFVYEHKGFKPDDDQMQRIQLVRDYLADKVRNGRILLLETEPQQKKFLSTHEPDFMLHGEGDWTGPMILERYNVTYDWLNKRGITLLFAPRTTGVSSTLLRKNR